MLSSPEVKTPPPLELAPAPRASRAIRSAPRKRPVPAPSTVPLPQQVNSELAKRQFVPRSAAGVGFAAAKGFVPRVGVLWTVSAPVVERSLDGGMTWHAVSISEGAEFHAVASAGSDVWAGGSQGALFHSSNSGASWTQVEVGAGGEALTGTIIAIRLPDASDIILETDSGQQWASRDSGSSWKRL